MELLSYSISSSFSKQHIIMMLENILEDIVDHLLGASLSLSIYWEIMNLIVTMIFKINILFFKFIYCNAVVWPRSIIMCQVILPSMFWNSPRPLLLTVRPDFSLSWFHVIQFGFCFSCPFFVVFCCFGECNA